MNADSEREEEGAVVVKAIRDRGHNEDGNEIHLLLVSENVLNFGRR